MSQTEIKLTLVCEPEVLTHVETALENMQVQTRKEKLKTPANAYLIYIPDTIWTLSVALNILEAKKDVIQGTVELSDGNKYELTQQGRAKFNEVLVEAMSRKREIPVAQAPWWFVPFIPEIKKILTEVIPTMKWYSKAVGEGKRFVTTVFMALLGGIVLSFLCGLCYILLVLNQQGCKLLLVQVFYRLVHCLC